MVKIKLTILLYREGNRRPEREGESLSRQQVSRLEGAGRWPARMWGKAPESHVPSQNCRESHLEFAPPLKAETKLEPGLENGLASSGLESPGCPTEDQGKITFLPRRPCSQPIYRPHSR